MIVVYLIASIAGIVLLVVNIRAMLAQIGTYNLLKELAAYGGFQNYQRGVAKKEAQEIISAGFVKNTTESINLQTVLLRFKDDPEAQELAKKLSEIKPV